MDGLYERDALAWSEQQAALLRRVANGERVNAAIDWAHVIDEVHDLGQSELHAVDRLLEQAMLHLLKIHLRPGSLAREHWQAEVAAFLDRAEQQYSPAMRQRLDLPRTYGRARRRAVGALGARAIASPPDGCPFALDALLACDMAALLALLRRE